MPRDSGEPIFAVRHQDVSQGPLGSCARAKSAELTELLPQSSVSRGKCFAERIFRRFFIFEKSWSKSKHAFRPRDATVDAHMLSLSTWAWWRLCDVLSARESRDGMGHPPRAGPLGRRRFFRRFSAHLCVTLEHLFLKRQTSKKNLRKICAKFGARNLRT